MSVGSQKLGGSAGGVAEYLTEEAEKIAGYYDLHSEAGLIFEQAWGKSAVRLGLEHGLTMAQFRELHEGRWNGEQLAQKSYRPVWERDLDGKIVRDPKTGKKIPQRDADGKMITEAARTPWIDLTLGTPKSVAEYMVATTPELREQIQAAFKASCALGIQALEDRGRLVRRSVQTPKEVHENGGRTTRQQGSKTERVRGAELIVIPVQQLSARPTQDTVDRDAPPDPHLHQHHAICTLAFLPDPTHPAGYRPLTVDDWGIKKTVEEIDMVVMGDFARRLELLGIEIEYTVFEDSRNGKITWEIAGSNPDARRHWSSNTKRADEIRREWEAKYDRPIKDAELKDQLRNTRKAKSKSELDQRADTEGVWDLWAADLKEAGIELRDALPLGHSVDKGSYVERTKILWDRLDSTKGLVREDAAFKAETVHPTIIRCAVDLGFEQEQLEALVPRVFDGLVKLREFKDEKGRPVQLFTTRVQQAKEQNITSIRQEMAHRHLPSPAPDQILDAIDAQPVRLEDEQRAAVFVASSPETSYVHITGPAGTGKSSTLKAIRDVHRAAGTVDEIIVVSTAAKAARETGLAIKADRFGSVESMERQLANKPVKDPSRVLWVFEEAGMASTDGYVRFLAMAKDGRVINMGDDRQAVPIGPAGWYQESVRDAVKDHRNVELQTVHRQRDHKDIDAYNDLRNGRSKETITNLDERGRVHVTDDPTECVTAAMHHYRTARDSGIRSDEVRFIVDGDNQQVDVLNRFAQRERFVRREIGEQFLRVHDVEQSRSWDLRERDQVVFLASVRQGRRDAPVPNGATGVVRSIDLNSNRVTVTLDNGRDVTVPLQTHALKQPLGLAYCLHVGKAQGSEMDVTLYLPSEHSNANSAYSALTRAKNEAHVFLARGDDDKPLETLATKWSEGVIKRTATSYHQRPERSERESKREGYERQSVVKQIDKHLRPDVTPEVIPQPPVQQRSIDHEYAGLGR